MSIARFFNPTSRTGAVSGDGFAPPRMTTADRLAIVFGPEDKGMTVYDTTLDNTFTWNGSAWESTPSSGDSSTTEVIYNDAGILKGDPTFTFNNVTKSVLIDSLIRIWRGAVKRASNIFIGNGTGFTVTTGDNNTAMGVSALASVSSGSTNVGIGVNALAAVTTTSGSTALGTNAGLSSTAAECVFVGNGAGLSNGPGARNTYVGNLSGQNGVNVDDNVGLGYLTLLNVASSRSTALGSQSLSALTSGNDNTGVGNSAGSNLTTGASNICIGSASQGSSASVSNELSIGSAARYVATDGAAATYFATATPGAVVLGNAVGFIRINLNGTFVKIPVYGN